MAFDAGMVHAIAHELNEKLSKGRVERVNQPEKDEIVLLAHNQKNGYRLSICASSNNPRVCLTSENKENPPAPPQFCIVLRKYLTGARIGEIRQIGFERVLRMDFDARDEMGFYSPVCLFCEIMGKYSNLVFCDGNEKILAVLRPVDFTTSSKRQLLPGMKYELPPAQDKRDPTTETREGFRRLLSEKGEDYPPDKFITANYIGISALNAREMALAGRNGLEDAFFAFTDAIGSDRYVPTLLSDETGRPKEYNFLPITQYGGAFREKTFESVSEMIEAYFSAKDQSEHTHQRAGDLFRLLENHKGRLERKMQAQRDELLLCDQKDAYKRAGDLLTASIYMLKRGMEQVTLTDYYEENAPEVTISLDKRLTPAQNAQAYYKKYNKAKNAQKALTEQLKIAGNELDFVESELDLLSRAQGAAELSELRSELLQAGYIRTGGRKPMPKSAPAVKPHEFVTSGGYRLLVGKNNVQNDQLTFRIAEKNDWWFHIKGAPGSHVLLVGAKEEPSAEDFTEAATVAAIFSSGADSPKTEVDYTQVRNLHKPAGAKPGFVTYTVYWSAVVTPDRDLLEKLKKDGK